MLFLLKNTSQVITAKVISAMLLLIAFFLKLILENGLFIIDDSLVMKYNQISQNIDKSAHYSITVQSKHLDCLSNSLR